MHLIVIPTPNRNHCIFYHKNFSIIGPFFNAFILFILYTKNLVFFYKGSVSLRPREKIKNSKVKIFFIVWSQCVLQCFNSYMKKYQCSKLNTYLVTIFLSEWGYCVYIEIPLRLSPAPTFRALKKYECSDVTFSYTHL